MGKEDADERELRTSPGIYGTSGQVFFYLSQKLGKPLMECFTQVVPTELPIDIYAIPPGMIRRRHVTLFTVGLSELELERSEKHGGPKRVELIMELPKDWPTGPEASSDPRTAWPITHLRALAAPISQYSAKFGHFFIGSATKNGGPIFPGSKMKYFMLVEDAKLAVMICSGEQIGFYRVTPIHDAEAQFAMKNGVMALIKEFDAKHVSTVVDIERASVV